jgi:ribose transport system ATP-binding protein
VLTLTEIQKSFSGTVALRGVTLEVGAGRTLGLVGENGAGKSTLMNVLGGNLTADAGSMELAGRPYRPRGPGDAAAAGVAFVHQELNLFPNLTVAENLFLTAFPRAASVFIDLRALRGRARALLAEVGMEDLDPGTPVGRLPAGQRQLVEVARALAGRPRLLILDEPTTSLGAREAENLFSLLRRLRDEGTTTIYISHALGDVLRLCDDVAVLRDGAVVGAGPRDGFTIDRMVTMMVGRPIGQMFPGRASGEPGDVVLEVDRLGEPGVMSGISFSLRRGEIVGLSGLMGSGRTEVARAIFGLDRYRSGSVRLGGEAIDHLPPRGRIARGLAFVTEDRRSEGLFADASVADNISLASAPALARGPLRWIDRAAVGRAVSEIRAAVALSPSARDSQPVRTLSGGNQQKAVLARWLLTKPRVLVLDEPTRGIDVGAKSEVYRLVCDLAAAGTAVLLISSEIEELVGLCDRILVIGGGELRDEVGRPGFDRERILRSALLTGQVPGARDSSDNSPAT